MAKRESGLEEMVTTAASTGFDPSFWSGKRVFLTGHTGFKGAWASLILSDAGAVVHGYSLEAPTSPSLFELAHIGEKIEHEIGDVRDQIRLADSLRAFSPEIVIHMAAQSLVRPSYEDPVGTYATNVMGTVNLLDAIRRTDGVRAAIVVTSDKCYDNREWVWGYRETDALGGHDPYSNSKGCAELVTDAFRRSYFPADLIDRHGVAIASVRAGNVIGGGDWAKDRLVPDAMRAFMAGAPLFIRYPDAIRPWQHVLDPVLGYLTLAQRMIETPRAVAEAWNFGPNEDSARTVGEISARLTALWGKDAQWSHPEGTHPHEAHFLKLDCTKAHAQLGWRPLLSLDAALKLTVDWYRAYADGEDVAATTLNQIRQTLAQPRR
jgi:CDP-glucose 4,6-dehydratase